MAKNERGVCKRTGFRYDWCGHCFAKDIQEEKDYLTDVGYGDAIDNDGEQGCRFTKYVRRMKEAKASGRRGEATKKIVTCFDNLAKV